MSTKLFQPLISSPLKENRNESNPGNIGVIRVSTDGMDYYHFSVVYVDGFGENAGYDCDAYFCKVKTLTKAELQELSEMLSY